MTTAITEYSATEAALTELAARFKGVVFDVTTTKGMDEAKKGRAEIRTLRTSLEAKRVEIKKPALERCRLIDAEAARITSALTELESPIDALIKKEERRKEEERAAKAKAEADRIERIKQRIDDISFAVVDASGKTAAQIAAVLEETRATVIDESYQEFKDQAQLAKDAAIGRLMVLHNQAIAHEAEQERIKAERAELARLRAEQEERNRLEQARIAEETRKRLAAEAESRAKIEAEEREARRARDEADRVAREARYKADAEAKAKREAEEAALKAERDKIEAERRAQAEAQRKEREAEEARQREVQRQKNEVLDANAMLSSFVKRFGHLPQFSTVVEAIQDYQNGRIREAA